MRSSECSVSYSSKILLNKLAKNETRLHKLYNNVLYVYNKIQVIYVILSIEKLYPRYHLRFFFIILFIIELFSLENILHDNFTLLVR